MFSGDSPVTGSEPGRELQGTMAGGLQTGKQTSGNHPLLVRNINDFLILGLCPLISNSWGPGIGADQ